MRRKTTVDQRVNGRVALRRSTAAPSLALPVPQAHHIGCGHRLGLLPAATPVIPGIHRPYDDYQSYLVTDLNQ